MSQVRVAEDGQGKFLVSAGRCDQCSKRHRKCNLQIPTCSNCHELGIACTRNRTLKYQLSLTYANVEKFRSKRESNNPKLTTLRHTKEPQDQDMVCKVDMKFSSKTGKDFHPSEILKRKKNKVTFETCRFKVNCLVVDSEWDSMIKKWYKQTYSRHDFYYFVNVTGIDLSRQTTHNQSRLSKLLSKKLELRKERNVMLLQVEQSERERTNLYNRALSAYFHYVNPFFPLFTEEKFKTKSRSLFLKYCLWRIGIQFLPRSSHDEVTIKTLDSQIIEMAKPSRLVVSLDSLQALLALRNGLFEFPLYKHLSLFHSMASSLITLLGLHKLPPGFLSPSSIIEREFSLKQAISISHAQFYNRGIMFCNLSPEFSCSLGNSNSIYSNLFKNCQPFDTVNSLDLKEEEKEGSPLSATSLPQNITISNQFNESLVWILSHCTYRGNAIHVQLVIQSKNSIDSEQNGEKFIKAENSLTSVFNWGIRELAKIKVALDSVNYNENQMTLKSELIVKITQIQVTLIVRFHFLSLRLIDKKLKSVLNPNLKYNSKLIKRGIRNSINVINELDRISKAPFLIDRAFILGTAARFLIQHYQSQSTDLEKYLHPIIRQLSDIQEHNIESYYSNGCLKIINTLLRQYHINLKLQSYLFPPHPICS